ncbi:hypothetical protein FA15DRAFT_675442 [Coprinopsis marcescibilis]|uniref:Secreted protein n=1 Tax=Coprinopsis marcescibilis TaxID=230819 RepID=A0A5C3KDY5_COPMA|nr:hypothetical protein FA15DRAFT_675442 [Coprinopsis marcescibilis]
MSGTLLILLITPSSVVVQVPDPPMRMINGNLSHPVRTAPTHLIRTSSKSPLNQATTLLATSSPCFRMLIVNYPPRNPIYDITHLESSNAPLLHPRSCCPPYCT